MFSVRDTTDKDLSWIDLDKYKLVRTKEELHRLISHLEASERPSLDCETEGLSHLCHDLVGLSFSPEAHYAYYIPLKHRYFENLNLSQNIGDIHHILKTFDWELWNAPFDWRMISARLKVDIKVARDVQADCWLLDSDRGPSSNRKKLRLDYVSKELLNIEQLKLEDLLEKDVKDFSLVQEEVDALMYAGGDADCTKRVGNILLPKILTKKLDKLSKLEAEVAIPSGDMEKTGIFLDIPHAKSISLYADMGEIQDKINRLVDLTINPGSPEQVASLIYDKLGIKATKADSRSVDEKALSSIKTKHKVIPLILEWRELSKLQGSFLDKLQEVGAEDGRLHGGFIATGTRSGRFSAAGGFGKGGVKIDVNGQQFPNSKKVNCRKILSATPHWYWVSADFGQVEYRGLAYISKDKGLLEAYADNVDIHQKTASLLLNVPLAKVTKDHRGKGKTLNFAIVFGMTDPGLAMALGCSIKEAAALKASYFKNIPGVDKLIRETKAFISKYGYVRTEFGRIRNYDFTGCSPERVNRLLMSGFNTRIQGTAADLNKIALVKVYKKAKKEFGDKVKFLSTIHDELNVEFHESIPVGVACAFMRETMSFKAGLFPGWLDFPADVDVGPSFGELVEVKPDQYSLLYTLQDVMDLKVAKKESEKAQEEEVLKPSEQKIRKIKVQAPAVILELKDSQEFDHLSKIQEVLNENVGTYQVFVKVDQLSFICHDFKVNPSPAVVEILERLCTSVEVLRPSQRKTFDPSALSF